MIINFRCIIIDIDPAVNMGFLTHAFDKQQTCNDHTDFNRNNQVKQNGKDEGGKQYDDVTLWCSTDQVNESTPLTHIISNDEKNRRNRWHRNHSGKWHQYNKYDNQCDRMNHSGRRF